MVGGGLRSLPNASRHGRQRQESRRQTVVSCAPILPLKMGHWAVTWTVGSLARYALIQVGHRRLAADHPERVLQPKVLGEEVVLGHMPGRGLR